MKLIIRFLAFCAVLFVLLSSATQVLMMKNSEKKLKRFFDKREDFDVLFTGISHMQMGVSPMELWNEYGIASFNLAQSFERLPFAYWVLQMALEYSHPSLVVIDVRRIFDTEIKVGHGVSFVMDYFPLTLTKFKAVNELLSDFNEKLAYLFPIIKYHERWEELTEDDFVVADYVLDNGASKYDGGGIKVYKVDTHTRIPADDMEPGQRYANGVQVIADEYGVPYLNFHQIPGVVSMAVDMANRSHLNDSGARKVSYYIGDFIKENFDIPDRRNDPAYASWTEQYETFRDIKDERIRGRRSLKKVLMLLMDRHVNTYIRIRQDSKLYDSSVLRKLVWNLSARDKELTRFVKASADRKEYSAFICNETGAITEQIGPEPLESEADGTYRFFNKLENEEAFRSSEYGVEIQAFNGETGEEIIHKVF